MFPDRSCKERKLLAPSVLYSTRFSLLKWLKSADWFSKELSELWFNTFDFFYLKWMWAFISNSHHNIFRCYFWIVQKPFDLLYSSFFSSLSLSPRWRMSTITLPSPRTLSTTQLSWRTCQRMCQSSVSKRRTLISPPLQVALVTASPLATHRISLLSTPERVRLAARTPLADHLHLSAAGGKV